MSRLSSVICLLGYLLLHPVALASPHIDPRIDFLARHAPAGKDHFQGSVRFRDKPTDADFERLRRLGVVFMDGPGGPLGSRTVYPADIPFAAVPRLKGQDDLTSVEASWRPGLRPQLGTCRPQVEADQVWTLPSPLGGTVSGRGVTIGNFDTGANHFHSQLFQLSGASHPWLDMNGSGAPDGGDGVDLDGDGGLDADEALVPWEVLFTHTFGNDPDRFDTRFDLLYNDANGNGVRDSGPPEFGEDDPCYGELILVARDTDGDGRLDPDEPLLALGPSKIRAIREFDGSVYRRGENLLQAAGDTWGHGTQVSSILSGGWAECSLASGVAPGAELVQVVQAVEENFTPLEAGLAWAMAEDVQVFLFEFGSWVWEYQDGSSNMATMINEYARDQGVIFVMPAGNMYAGGLHCRFDSDETQALVNTDSYQAVWITFLWTTPVSLALTLTPAWGNPVALPLDGSTTVHDGTAIYSRFSVSPRGTRRIDLQLSGDPAGSDLSDSYNFDFTGYNVEIHGYMADDHWGFGSHTDWQRGTDPGHTVTWPATADSGLVVGSYDGQTDGDIAWYSCAGPRIDGYQLVDLAAPGLLVHTASPYSQFNFSQFGGTSAAAPFVAGAAALLKELWPDLDGGRCQQILRAGAQRDQYTFDIHRSGGGKLRINAAIAQLLSHLEEGPPEGSLQAAAWPNPANPRTSLRFHQDRQGPARVRVFDVRGREVWDRELPAAGPGWRTVDWNGCDRQGVPVASGAYLAHFRQGTQVGVCKVVVAK